MRVFRLTGAYRLYLDKFYRERPGLDQVDYPTQRRALDQHAFGWADFWEKALAPLGVHMESAIANAESLQRAWAREKAPGSEAAPLADILLAQLRRVQPEVLFLEDFSVVPGRWLEEARRTVPSIRAIVAWCGAPYGDVDVFQSCDLVLSNIPDLVTHFRKAGRRAELFRHAFEPRILNRLRLDDPKKYGLSFVGQVALGRREHRYRLQVLKRLARHHSLEVFCQLGDRRGLAFEVKQVVKLAWYLGLEALVAVGVPKKLLNSIPFIRRPFYFGGRPRPDFVYRLAFPRLHPSVYGVDMYQVVRDSRVTLNSHIDIAGDSASNMRLFEATGTGTCLLTDWKSDLLELFEPDREVVTYRSIEECIDKAGWLLERPQEAERIAVAGQRRTLRDHTFAARAPHLVRLFEGALQRSVA